VTSEAASGRRAAPIQSRWLHFAALAVPFLVVIVAWHGLRGSFPAFQGGDEVIHFGIVRLAADRWPRLLLGGYGAWSGPLVYWLLATFSLPFGTTLGAVRLVVTACAWGTCVVAYMIFRDRLGARPLDALGLALLLAVSPFFLGQSFHVLTDNPTWFFVVLALERCLAYVERPGLGKIAAFAACLAAATTMRQISIWLALPALVAVVSVPGDRRQKLAALALLALGLVPLAMLLVYWGGPLPPATASSGAVETPVAAGYRIRNLLLSLGVTGVYAVFLVPGAELHAWWNRVRREGRWAVRLMAAAVVALALVAVGSLGTVTSFLTLVSRLSFPTVGGASLLFWVFVPLGALVTAALLWTRLSDVRSRVLVASLAGVLLSAMANPRWFERYVDFPILLLFCALALASGLALRRSDRERWLLAGVIAVASFVLLL